MEIKEKDLKVGDEIIVSRYSNLRYLRILRLPRVITKLDYKGVPYTHYGPTKCSVGGKRVNNGAYTFFADELTPDNHTETRNLYLGYKQMWLVYRKDN